MCESEPRPSHWFLAYSPYQNQEASEHIAREFCRAYQRQYDESAVFLGKEAEGVDAIGINKNVCCDVPDTFDKVWWAENTYYVDAAALFEV